MEYVIRFFLGGLIVSAFALLSDLLRPRTFSGIFGAAPTVALSTLGITFFMGQAAKVATEGRSMLLAALALFVYALLTRIFLKRKRISALPSAFIAYLGWFASAFLIWFMFLK